ncbi:uncharacterized protein [Mytilus edulis]|uniref:uncharacterized protein n=1 Tax=Mytilus edulis TaxID=6550 RepID=UPI0039F066AA
MEPIAVKCRSVLNYLNFHGSEHIGKEESRGEKSNVNYALRKLISFRYNDILRCDSCTEKGKAIGYCNTCSGFIDQSCLGFHQRILKWRRHKYFIFDTARKDRQITDFVPEYACQIKKHDNGVVDAYCRKCKVAACNKCIKRHRKKCRTINSLQEWYHLLQVVIKTKDIVENLIRTIPRRRNEEKFTILSIIVVWLDQTLGIGCNTMPYSPIKERLELAASTENQSYYIASNTVVDKFCEIQQELQREFYCPLDVLDGVQREVDRQTVEQHDRQHRHTEDTTTLKQTINSNQIEDFIEEENMSSSTEESSSSDDQSNSESGFSHQTYQTQMTVPDPIGNMDQGRFQQVSDDLGEDNLENNVPIEKDIKILHEARLETFERVHSDE